MNPTAVAQKQNPQLLFVKNRLVADNSRNLPTRLELLRAGIWENSWKGDLEITIADLLEMKVNFAKGTGLPGKGVEGAPVDYSHNDYAKAAFWIKALEVDEANGILYASEIEWTPAGKEAVLSGEFKFFSPSVYPRCLGKWQDPEDPTHLVENVLVGGGLTNIPFFKGLSGLNASQSPEGNGGENVIYLANEGEDMELATVRNKNKEDLTAEELAFVGEHKAELTAEEQIKFGLEEAPATKTAAEIALEKEAEDAKKAAEATASPEAVALQASISAGTHVVIEKTQLANLQASADKSAQLLADMQKKEVEARVDAHVQRGAIKSDQAEKWTGLILADASNEDLLKSLADNQLVASELGGEGDNANPVTQLREKAQVILKASVDAGDANASLATAMVQARKENPELAQEADKVK